MPKSPSASNPGRQVFRVRVGPFDKKEDADRQKEKLESGGVETALVRVQR